MFEHADFPVVEESNYRSRMAINQPLRKRNRQGTCGANDYSVWAESAKNEESIVEEE
jgi:hypothetical protein